jgi:uncharacterized protein YdiU (UPF0061 family)
LIPFDNKFDNTYARLPARFYARVDPTPVAAPRLIQLNHALARELGLDPAALESPHGVEVLAGNRIAPGSEPIAIAYAGHQFGHFVPQLGDGRAILLGEVLAPGGRRFDIQLKGPGPTPFSRGGDGRAALGPVLREYILSEAMFALGVPTTRALAAVATGQPVFRETPLPGAVFTRVASSHLRVGTFQYFAARGDTDGLRILAGYAIARHYPHAAHAQYPVRALLDGVIARHAQLVAQWMLLGFIHGVMNTDNTSISGETIDYGPCAFMEAYHPTTVFSSIDRQGRYGLSNQPHAAHWNLTRLAESLLPILLDTAINKDCHPDPELAEGEGPASLAPQNATNPQAALDSAHEALAAFAPQYEAAHAASLRRKLGLLTQREGDPALANDLLDRMAANRADFTLTFHLLCDSAANPAAAKPTPDARIRALFADPTAFDAWAIRWRARLAAEDDAGAAARIEMMRAANPAFIPRNHLVEAAINAAIDRQDFQLFEELLDVVTRPYEDRPALARFAQPARPEEAVTRTFCGT